MNIRQLKFFLSAADTGSFYSAAERLYVSRPAVSKSISQLEDEIGQPLFVRKAEGVCLTATGKKIYPRIRRLVEEFEALEGEMQEMKRGVRMIRIGFCHSTYLLFMDRIQEFGQAHPDIYLELSQYQYEDVLPDLKNGQIDLAISGYAFQDESLVRQPAYRCQALWGVPSDSEMGRRGFITDEEIRSYPICFPSGSRSINLDVAVSTVTDFYTEESTENPRKDHADPSEDSRKDHVGSLAKEGGAYRTSGFERIGQRNRQGVYILDDNMFYLCKLVLQGKAIFPIGKELLPARIEGISWVPCPEHHYYWQVDSYYMKNRHPKKGIKLLLEEVFAFSGQKERWVP